MNYASEPHGGLNPDELNRFGIPAEQIIDFSVNSNPFGPAPAVLQAIRQVNIAHYPDRQAAQLTQLLADKNQVAMNEILLGNGTAELIWLIMHAFIKPNDLVLILGPTFGDYQRAALTCGAVVKEITAQPQSFEPPIEKLIKEIKRQHPRLIFLCNPNNPTGTYIPPESLLEIANACSSETMLIIDEAYRAFMDGKFFAKPIAENCLVLRSMTKDFALAGLRLGYVLGKASLFETIAKYQPTWSVNAMAQAAGIAAITSIQYYEKTLAQIKPLKQSFFAQLDDVGYRVVPSVTHFGIIHVEQSAYHFRQTLLREGIQVRDCTSFGLPEYIRISTQKEEDNQILLNKLPNIAKEQH